MLSVVAGSSAKALMIGIQSKSIQIKGNPMLVIGFQRLTQYSKSSRPSPRLEVFQLNRIGFIAGKPAPTGII
jgi:hypothetical protein